MKNTKHTENLDNSTPQEITSQSKRKILTSIGVSSGIIGASALSQQWTKPIVNSIILPAHAQSTPMMTTMAMGDMTTTPSMSDGMDDGTTTTMMPTTTMAPAPASRIMVVAGQTGSTIGDGSTAKFHISLMEQPLDTVTVAVAAAPAGSAVEPIQKGPADALVPIGDGLMFTRANYKDEQTVTVTAAADVPTDPDFAVTFKASGGGYDDEENSVMLTIVNDDDAPPRMLMGMDGKGKVTISWTKPDTTKTIVGYVVQVRAGNNNAPAEITEAVTDGESGGIYTKNAGLATMTDVVVPGGTGGIVYSYRVNVVFKGSPNTYMSAPGPKTVSSN